MRAGGPRPLYAFKNTSPEPDLSVLASCANFRPSAFAVRFRPTETPIPGASADAQVGPRLPFGERASPTHHTGRRAALTPTCGLFPEPALLVPLDAPSCPVAAHRPPDAPNLSIGPGGRRTLDLGCAPRSAGPRPSRPGPALQSAANRAQLRPGAVARSAGFDGRRQLAGRARASSARSQGSERG